MLKTVPVITIDGPSGVGKGTVCQTLANKLNWNLLDSGAIYRVLAYLALEQNVNIDIEEQLVELATNLDVQFIPVKCTLNIVLAGEEVSNRIRTENVGNVASKIATFPLVREALLYRQRNFRQAPGLVADGRDMGTIVFPDAPVKIFLDASAEERAQRRMLQLQKNGFNVKFGLILSEIQERDARDRDRIISPLVAATDALVVDSTKMSVEQVLAVVTDYAVNILKTDVL